MALREISAYPWSGKIRLEVTPESPATFDLKLRIPGWAKGASASLNGQAIALNPERGYAAISRRWRAGDFVDLDLPMPAERTYAHPNVRMDVGRVALRRGPLIYCVEEADNPGGAVQTMKLPRGAPLEVRERGDLFDGIVTLEAPVLRLFPADASGALYSLAPPAERQANATALPYFLWNNRGPGSMLVWIAEG